MKNDMKTCEVCGKQKQMSEMSKSYKHRCKECVAEQTRLARAGAEVVKEAARALPKDDRQFKKAVVKDTGETVMVRMCREPLTVRTAMYETPEGRMFPMFALEYKKEIDACYAAEKQIEEDFLKAKQVFKEKGEYKGDFTELQEELFDGCLYAQHIGYVNVELLSDIKNTVGRYSTTERFFKVVDDGTKEAKEIQKLTFSEEVIDVVVGDDDEQCFYLVCQWCNYEDDYKGYILLPMKDGRYWCFYYQM